MLNHGLLDAVRTEIREHEAALAKLRDIERLTLELLPPEAEPATPAPERVRRSPATSPRRAAAVGQQRPRLVVGDVIDTVRDLLTAGPTSINAVFAALGRSRTKRSEEVVLAALEELGAVTAGSQRGGGVAYKLPSTSTTPQVSPGVRKLLAEEAIANGNGNGASALEDQVLDAIKRVGGRVALPEIEHQLRRRHLEFTSAELEEAADRLETHLLIVRDPGGGLRLPMRPLEAAAMDAAGVEAL